MLIRRLALGDALAYWETRNRGLKEFPDAFTSSHEEGVATPPEVLAKRFGDDRSDDFVLGAFGDEGVLCGHAGFQRELRAKNRHKGTLIGMYVVPESRGRQVGRLLLARLLEEVRATAGVEQVILTVTHSNEAARMLYLRAGFVSFGIEKNALKFEGRYFDKEYMMLLL